MSIKEIDMKKCSNCSSTNTQDARFCEKCGSKLSKPINKSVIVMASFVLLLLISIFLVPKITNKNGSIDNSSIEKRSIFSDFPSDVSESPQKYRNSSDKLPTGKIFKCLIEISPDTINYFIVNIDSDTIWQVQKESLNYNWRNTQDNATNRNSTSENLKQEIDALIGEIVNIRSGIKDRIYFVSFEKYKNNNKVKAIQEYLSKKGYDKIVYLQDNDYNSSSEIRPSLQYLLKRPLNETLN